MLLTYSFSTILTAWDADDAEHSNEVDNTLDVHVVYADVTDDEVNYK